MAMLLHTLPNLITLLRLFAVPVTVGLIVEQQMEAAFWLFVAAGVSDGIDGFLARLLKARTRLGAILDPIADKTLLVAMFVALGFAGHVPNWLVILVVSRDLLIVGWVLIANAVGQPVKIKPILSSKINTTAQIMLTALVVGSLAFGWQWPMLEEWLIWITAVTTIISGFSYLFAWLRTETQAERQRMEHRTQETQQTIDEALEEELGATMIDLVQERRADVAKARENVAKVRENVSERIQNRRRKEQEDRS